MSEVLTGFERITIDFIKKFLQCHQKCFCTNRNAADGRLNGEGFPEEQT